MEKCNITTANCPAFWTGNQSVIFHFTCADHCHYIQDQSHFLSFNFNWHMTSRAWRSWHVLLPNTALYSIPTLMSSSSWQQNRKNAPVKGMREVLTADLGFTSISATHLLSVTLCAWFSIIYLEQFYLLCRSCLFLVVVFWNCLLLLCLLVCLMHCCFGRVL